MHSYHVYFDAREGVSRETLLDQVQVFMEQQRRENHVVQYRVLKMTNKASFPALADYHLIVDYESGEKLREALANMQGRYTKDPHRGLMGMVANFKVAFSEDASEQE